MNHELLLETEKLTRSWAQHEGAWLRDYLVAGVEDPRVNLQSILSRQFLMRALTGLRFDALMQQECRFAAVMDWLNRLARLARDPVGRNITLYALQNGADNAEGLEIPPFVSQTFKRLTEQAGSRSIPNYIEAFLRGAPTENRLEPVDSVLDTFVPIWADAIEKYLFAAEPGRTEPSGAAETGGRQPPQRLSILEPACGSANDYRFLRRYGIAALLDYTGFDLCAKNIQNARTLFPDVRFEVGNVFEIDAPTKSFDLCVVHDLLEHLSLAGMEQAVREICRVTREGICVGFFQMDEIPEHLSRLRDDYHWNLLSMAQMRQLFAEHGFSAQVVHIGSFLARQIGWGETHNPNAYTFFLQPL